MQEACTSCGCWLDCTAQIPCIPYIWLLPLSKEDAVCIKSGLLTCGSLSAELSQGFVWHWKVSQSGTLSAAPYQLQLHTSCTASILFLTTHLGSKIGAAVPHCRNLHSIDLEAAWHTPCMALYAIWCAKVFSSGTDYWAFMWHLECSEYLSQHLSFITSATIQNMWLFPFCRWIMGVVMDKLTWVQFRIDSSKKS